MKFNKILENSRFSKHLPSLPYLLIPCLLATWLYSPALFYGRIQIIGDSIIHSLSVIEFNRKMLHEGISPLWTNLLYGGHPYFAEGQGGFLNPLNFIVALLFDPIAGQNIYNWLSIIIGALGMYLLCRHFRCTREASTFGALAVVFSTFWIQYHDNVTVTGALCCLPWVFLCFERWIRHPTFKSCLWLALSMSLLIFAGYPQAVHGAVIYMAVSLIPTLFAGYIGNRPDYPPKQYVLSGLTAIVVCIGLSAMQWLPLLELTTWSHRSGGLDLVLPKTLSEYLRGFLFSIPETNNLSFRVLGSVLVCFVASLSLTRKPNHRQLGHIIAILFLVLLGLEHATPVFEYLRKYSLVPGLKYFRVFHLYLGIGIIGIGLLCGIAIDRIQRRSSGLENQINGKLIFFACASVLFLVWIGLVLWLEIKDVTVMQYVSFIGAYIVLMVFIFVKKTKWFGHVVLVLLVMEIIILRIAPFPFSDPKLLEKPQLVKHIQADVRNKDYKLMDMSSSWVVGLLSLWSPKLEVENRKAFMRAYPSINVLWDIPSIDACLALPLARRRLIQPKMEAEVLGTDSALPGIRLIDYLGVRFISTNEIYKTSGLRPLITDGIIIMENKYALPNIQSFTRYEIVNSANEALTRLKQTKEAILLLEPPFNKNESAKYLPASTNTNIANALEILSAKMTNVQCKFDIHARQPAWLFIADANYPGWQAQVDGQSVPVYSAQILGKAVFVPSGTHQITVEYRSRSFMIGVCLLLFTLLVLLIAGIRSIYLARLGFGK